MARSKTHYTVNEDVYGIISKPDKPRVRIMSNNSDYAEVFETCEGLGNFQFMFLQ